MSSLKKVIIHQFQPDGSIRELQVTPDPGSFLGFTDNGDIMPLAIPGSRREVAFPSTATSPGLPGDYAYGTHGGFDYKAEYVGDGVTDHKWRFLLCSLSYPPS